MTHTLLPEWDCRNNAVMIAWPHAGTDWSDMLAEVDACYTELFRALLRAYDKVMIVTPEPDRVRNLLGDFPSERVAIARCETNDTWTRDYGPLTVADPAEPQSTPKAVTFKFDGWGLKFAADLDNLVFLRLVALSALTTDVDSRKRYVLEGGSVETDGRGTILTTSQCMLAVNRNGFISKEGVERVLADTLGAQRVLWLDHGALEGDDTDSHVDTLARFAPDDTIIYVKAYDRTDPHATELDAMEEELRRLRTAEGNPYHLIGLPLPHPVYDPDDPAQRLPATYANFLIAPNAVLMPTYAQPDYDEMAAQMLRIAFPNHEIIAVDCRALIRQHGSLHCATMQLPAQWLAI